MNDWSSGSITNQSPDNSGSYKFSIMKIVSVKSVSIDGNQSQNIHHLTLVWGVCPCLNDRDYCFDCYIFCLLSCVHTQKKVVVQERTQAQNRSENTSVTVLNWNGSENTFVVYTDIEPFNFEIASEPFRERFRVSCGVPYATLILPVCHHTASVTRFASFCENQTH